ncbi:MAG: S-layer homology domain-containing protein [Tumebacillaceae bacterium]
MKLRKGMRFANAMLLNIALLFGASNAGALAASPAQQIYGWPTINSKTESEPVIVTKGVTYQNIQFATANGPVMVHETWVDLSDPNVRVKTVLSGDKLESDRNETVSEMAHRTGAVVGINGDFFESGTSGMALNMSMVDGNLLHSPTQSAILGIDEQNKVQIGKFSFTGSVTASNGQKTAINALNAHPVSFPNAMVLITPELGYWEMAANATVVTLMKQPQPGTWKAVAIDPAKTVVEAPYPDSVKLLAQGKAAIDFVTANIRQGDILKLDYGTNPSSANLKYAIGGGPILLKDGQAFSDPDSPLNQKNYRGPLTGVGVAADGKKMLQVVVDGRTSDSIGLTYGQMTNYFATRGIANAMMLDGGGSSVMAVRQPGATATTVANDPSDGVERRPANGLFVYSTSPAGAPTHITINEGNAVELFKGMTANVKSYVRDENYNPLPGEALKLSVEPETLGTISPAGVFTAGAAGGTGKIIVTASNGAKGELPVTVYETVDSLKITPEQVNLGNGDSQTFQVTGSLKGKSFAIKPEYLTWSVNDAKLGAVNEKGTFTAADGTERGTAKVSAKIGNASAVATASIGYVQKTLDSLEDAAKWVRSTRWGEVGTLSKSTAKVQGGKQASLAVNYTFAAGSGLKQFVFYPKDTQFIPSPSDNALVNPIGTGVWVYGDNSGGKLIASFERPDGSVFQANLVKVNWTGWKYVTFKFPSGTKFPLKLDFLDYSVESPEQAMAGSLYFSDLQALYAAGSYQEKPAPPAPPKTVTFDDIQNHWGQSIIEQLATKGIIAGTSATTFSPETGLTRAEAVALIVRSVGLQGEGSDKFTDVPSGEWYAKSVGAAVKAGIVNGVEANKFAPNDPVDRNQASKMIYNALKYKNKAPSGGTPIQFQDAAQIAPWAKAEVDALSAAGLMVGDGAGHLDPVKVTTRAEAAAMIYKMSKYAGLL